MFGISPLRRRTRNFGCFTTNFTLSKNKADESFTRFDVLAERRQLHARLQQGNLTNSSTHLTTICKILDFLT